MAGETAPAVARFAARLAAAHDAGKVVLLALVETGERGPAVDSPAHLERHPPSAGGDGAAGGPDGDGDAAGGEPVAAVAARLESEAATVRSDYGVPCEVAVAGGDPTEATFRTARETNCDLVVAPYETDDGQFSAFAGEVLAGPLDAVLLDTDPGRRRWERVLVMVSRPGDSAHAMVDFAERLTRGTGRVSVCTCIDREVERRPAETRLANLVGTVDSGIETRVARSDVDSFLAANADAYDLVVVGSSGDRSPVSRLLSPPTAARLDDLACDLAVVDRADP
jgi:nucleotide-binding universal stress UspA family protein